MTPADFLGDCTDETLVELLAFAEEGTPVERNVIATELTNRLAKLHRLAATHAHRVQGLLDANRASRDLAEAGARKASDSALDSLEAIQQAGVVDQALGQETDSYAKRARRHARKDDGEKIDQW